MTLYSFELGLRQTISQKPSLVIWKHLDEDRCCYSPKTGRFHQKYAMCLSESLGGIANQTICVSSCVSVCVSFCVYFEIFSLRLFSRSPFLSQSFPSAFSVSDPSLLLLSH